MAKASKTGKPAKKKKETKKKQKKETKKAVTETEGESDDYAELSLVRALDFRKAYVTRTLSFPTEFDIRITLSNETMGNEEGTFTVVDEMLILTPTAARELQEQLTGVIGAWEEMNGKVPDRPSRRKFSFFIQEK